MIRQYVKYDLFSVKKQKPKQTMNMFGRLYSNGYF